jgi:prepilin-type N-terminal cleavage/methylation domain-containing protein
MTNFVTLLHHLCNIIFQYHQNRAQRDEKPVSQLPAQLLHRSGTEMTRRKHNLGFTLVELMIVVAILGILSVVAFAAYGIYIRESRNAEATSILADIRLKQEAYRGTFHRYATVEASCDNWVPRGTPDAQSASAGGIPQSCKLAWRQLGIAFPDSLYFVYDSRAGAPTSEALSGWYADANTNDFWYAAAAVQDLDGNGECAGFKVVSGDMSMIDIAESTAACTYAD